MLPLFKLSLILSLLISGCPMLPASGEIIEETEAETIKKEFLGIDFGCSVEEMQEVLEKSIKKIEFVKKEHDNGTLDYYYLGNHRLNDVTATVFSFWKDKLLLIAVHFETEAMEKMFAVIKAKMEKKYGGKMVDQLSFSGEKCTMLKGGMGFYIEGKDRCFKIDTVTVVVSHVSLLAAKEAAEAEKRGEELGEF